MQDARIRAAIEAMGRELTPAMLPAVQELFRAEQEQAAAHGAAPIADIAYGDHERQRVDLYKPRDSSASAPVLVWVHGGGFMRGGKSAPHHPFEAHIGRYAAQLGFLGVVMNYRLAPQHQWPSGGEDVCSVVDWLTANARRYGADGGRIVLAGTSAGAVHVAEHLRRRLGGETVRGAILLSGLYGYTKPDGERDLSYYGAERKLYKERAPKQGALETTTPLFVACAEFDPPRFQEETFSLLRDRLRRRRAATAAYVARGHNHYSLSMHIGGADVRLSTELEQFLRACVA